MKKTRFGLFVALALSLVMGTFACSTTGEAEVETAAEDAQPMETGEILHVLSTINEGEVSHAQLALERSDNPEVQEAAQRILEDHRMMDQRINQIARNTNSELQENELSQAIETQATQFEEELADLSGEEFDRQFLQRQIELHEVALQTAREDLMPNATEPEVEQLLTDASQDLEHHLTLAQQRFEQMEDEAIGGGPEDDGEQKEKDKDK